MRRFRSVYFKIFVWFWVTLVAGSVAVLAMTLSFSGMEPLGYRWMRATQDLYAHTAVDFYETGGRPALERYLDVLRESSGMSSGLLDGTGSTVIGGVRPPETAHVLEQSVRTGRSSVRLGRVWTAASPVAYRGQTFVFVVAVHPLRGFIDGTFAGPLGLRLLLALLVAGLFCWMLARNLVAPIRALQTSALRLAGGDLASRVMSRRIARREDELTDTARAFDQMADKVQGMVEKRQALLADISHELRSPLTRLSVSLELMRRGETDLVEQMQVDLDRMNTMIGQILLLARLDVTDAEPATVRLNLRPMLEGIAEEAEFEAQEALKRVTVLGLEQCYVAGAANLLRSCFENVIRNAVRYTADETAVEIYLTQKASHCEIRVLDHGPGVPEESLPFLFEPFYRVSESRDRAEGGTGLGLSIAQRVLALHGGSISPQNRTDSHGLCVTIVLPRDSSASGTQSKV